MGETPGHMDIYGHLFPSDAEDLADKLDALWRDSVTDKRRTKRALTAVDGKSRDDEPQGPQGIPAAPSAGIEPKDSWRNRLSVAFGACWATPAVEALV